MISKLAKKIIKELALKSPHHEICGLVYGDEALQIANIHPMSDKAFLLDPEKYVDEVAILGEPDAIWHTHPTTSQKPSQADIASCNEVGILYVIYSLLTKRFGSLKPAQFELPLENRPFSFPGADCWALIRDYYRINFKISLQFSDYDYTDIMKGVSFDHLPFADLGFSRVSTPQKHDLVVMSLRAGGLVNHGAIYGGDNTIFHQLMERPSRHEVYGGYWKQNTIGFFRHEGIPS